MSNPPTESQQKGVAYAHIPFAIISAFSSGYVIFYLLWKERQKLKRLYHRLVLAMNFALLPLSTVWALRTFAAPEGTPYSIAASGSIQTCTASGFLFIVLIMTVPIYYSSLSLQALVALRNNFKEEKYCWIEKYIHISAWCIPCIIATVFAATENINPSGAGCFVTKAPPGCKIDPNVPCERGKDVGNFGLVLAFILIFTYCVVTPSVLVAIYCGIVKVQKKMDATRGMQRLRESAKEQMMESIGSQIFAYFFTFLLTWVVGFLHTLYFQMIGELLYDLQILASCLNSIQGFAFAVVYFTIQRMGEPQIESVPQTPSRKGRHTVESIRTNAERISVTAPDNAEGTVRRGSFNIFDGVPDKDSPWAKFFLDEDDECTSSVESPDEGETSSQISNHEWEPL